MLPISSRHVTDAPTLPPHHRDPFDRMLIAQSESTGWIYRPRRDETAYREQGMRYRSSCSSVTRVSNSAGLITGGV
jgi:hypothetical protein